jgi:DNA polymerase III subunit chi
MTRIDFHTHVDQPVAHTCKVLRKARAAGNQCVVYCSRESTLDALDKLLWTFSPLDFLPHVYAHDPLAEHTPIVLTAKVADTAHHDVLINLDEVSPTFFSRFERVIEVVALDENAAAAGRMRYKFYKERGYELTHHRMDGA